MKNEETNKDAVQGPSDEVSLDRDTCLAFVIRNGLTLDYVNKLGKDWALKNFNEYYQIARVAVKQNGYALEYVNEAWALKHPTWYKEVALVAVRKKPYALSDINDEWAVKKCELYKEIVKAAVDQNGLAFRYAGEVFRNNIKIAISSLIHVDRSLRKWSIMDLYEIIEEMLSSPCEPSDDILLYLYIFSNKTVANKFKNALLIFFIKKFENSDKFTLYKNILECYLTLSKRYTKDFPNDKLLANLSEDDSKQLHMFLSIADPSALKNTQLAKLLENDHNDIIENYLTKDIHNLKSIKNFNIYSSLLPKNLFVINYDKIINMMKNTTLMNKMKNDNLIKLIKLILCYSRIEDLLALSKALNLGDKLEVRYLDIDPKFEREDSYISNGIEGWVDAIKSNDGFLSNTGKYKYDSLSPTYNSVDIKLSQQSKLIELRELIE